MAWKVRLENLVRSGHLGYRMLALRENYDGSVDVMCKAMIHHHEQGSFIPESESILDDGAMPQADVQSFLQAMSDAAWEIGIKPKQIEDSRNELKAVRYHLEDMRVLAKVKK